VRWRGRDLGALLAKAGWAWHDTRTKRFAQLARLAAAARAAKRGLWANASAVAPWTFQRVALWGDVKRKTAHHSWDCAVTKRGWPPGGTLFYSLADARKGGYRLHRCITARYQRLIADNAPQSSGVPSPPASGRCRRDRDCALAPHPPCVCGSCGGTWRKPTTRARARAMKARFSRLRCEPQACPACVTRYLGTRAVCVAGRCSVR
ncbi:MAG: hypothetical protein KC503_11770, partial [Myxococcales bacterium]|nr:hypothetical protein [Myxococcales bacterium]